MSHNWCFEKDALNSLNNLNISINEVPVIYKKEVPTQLQTIYQNNTFELDFKKSAWVSSLIKFSDNHKIFHPSNQNLRQNFNDKNLNICFCRKEDRTVRWFVSKKFWHAVMRLKGWDKELLLFQKKLWVSPKLA